MEDNDKAFSSRLNAKPELDLLRKLPLLSALAEKALAEFRDRTETVLFGADQTVYRIGDATCPMYIVLVGKVRLFTSDKYGKRITLAHLTPGEVLGELPDAGGERCSTTAVAIEESWLIILDPNNLSYLFSVQPDAALQLIGALEARLRRLHSLLRTTV